MKGTIACLVLFAMLFMLISCASPDSTIVSLNSDVAEVPPTPTPPAEIGQQVENGSGNEPDNGLDNLPDNEPDNGSDIKGDLDDWVITIVTGTQTPAEYEAARRIVEKYGANIVIHREWLKTSGEYNERRNTDRLLSLARLPNMRAFVFAPAHDWSNAVESLREFREDIFVAFVDPGGFAMENPLRFSQIADISLRVDHIGSALAMAQKASEMGATTFLHYSRPDQMSWHNPANLRREVMKSEAGWLGMEFVDATYPGPVLDRNATHQFFAEDVPHMTSLHGVDTAFYSASCTAQRVLVETVVEAGAMLVDNCCGNPYKLLLHPVREAGRPEGRFLPLLELLPQQRELLAEKNMLGRIAALPEAPGTVLTAAAAEYAIKWIKGEVPKEGFDIEVLRQIMEDLSGVGVVLTPHTNEETGEDIENFLLMHMGYIVF